MNKEIKVVKAANSKKLQLTVLIPLTPSQFEKMEENALVPVIDNIAKDMHVTWAIRLNSDSKTAEISSIHDDCITSQIQHDAEIIAIDFMSAIDKLELPKPISEPKCPSHEAQENETQEIIDIMKQIVKDIDEGEKICAIVGVGIPPVFIGKGNISMSLLKEMCELYLKTHE